MIEIRPCTLNDLPAVQALLRQLAEVAEPTSTLTLEELEKTFLSMTAQPSFYDNYVAMESMHVVGFISIIYYQTMFHQGGTALINELVVDRDRRGAGIGKALIARAVHEAKARGQDELEVATELDNEPASSFYRACGFDVEYRLLGLDLERER